MIQNKEKILKNRRLCQAIFGVSRQEIENLLPTFSQCLIAHRHKIRPVRQNKIGQGRKGDLPSDLDKLLYILSYLKIYPTYDAMSVLSDHQRSKCGDSVKFLLPALEAALKRKLVLPKRKPRKLDEIFRDNPELKDVFLDGSERRVQKPKNNKKRNKLYSGKKKATKNNPLTFEQKQNNRIISGIRIVSEHAIGGYKRFKAASDIYRNKLANMDDRMNLVCAGLWNWHLEQTA